MELKTPVCELAGELDSIFVGSRRKELVEALPRFMFGVRWFSGKFRQVRGFRLLDVSKFEAAALWRILLVAVDYLDGGAEIYSIPVVFVAGRLEGDPLASAIISLTGSHHATLCDASAAEPFWRLLCRALVGGLPLVGEHGRVECVSNAASESLDDRLPLTIRVLEGEQSNTSAVVGSIGVIKLFRQISDGENPELEMGRFLTRKGYCGTPSLLGGLQYRQPDGRIHTLAVMHEFVANEGSGWSHTLEQVGRYLESHSPDQAESGMASYHDGIELLGRRTGELHLALADGADPSFAPEPFTTSYQRDISQAMCAEACKTFAWLRASIATLDRPTAAAAERLLESESRLLDHYRVLMNHGIRAMRIRCHGDFHLGQVLFTGGDFRIIDFEGEPGRPIAERRLKTSPIRDVAGMLRSFHYASRAALRLPGCAPFARRIDVLSSWCQVTSARFLKGYLPVARQGNFLPASEDDFRNILTAYTLDKAIYELRYELSNRPDWVSIPIDGLLSTLGASH